MKNLAIVAPSPVPFREGGAERLWNGLAVELRRQGTPTELLKTPVRERTLTQLVTGYAAFAEWDLAHFDQVITGKYPAWAVDHPNHRLWMLHPLRGLYDRYPTHLPAGPGRRVDPDLAAALELPGRLAARASASGVILEIADRLARAAERLGPDHPDLAIPSPTARALVQGLDHHLLAASRVRSHAAISAEVATRPAWFPPGIRPLVVHPPLDTDWAAVLAGLAPPERTPGAPLRVLSVGRLERAKRHDLAIAGVKAMTRPARLRIVGTGPDADRLAELTTDDERIELLGGLDDRALAEAYGWADVLCFTSDREDYGLVTLEALTAGRGVIATTDAGGALELLNDSGATGASHEADGPANGMVVAPRANDLGDALDSIAGTDGLVERMGEAARISSTALSWERTIEALVDPPRKRRVAGAPGPVQQAGQGPSVVALSTYPIGERRQGGELRAFHLLAGLADAGAQVLVVSLTTDADRAGRRRLAPGFDEETVAISPRQSEAEHRMRLVSTTHAITDIAASLLWSATPEFTASVRAELADAAVAVLVQPYLASALAALAPRHLPVVLDAQNHEATMKASLLGGTRGGRWLAREAADAERLALDLAAAVVTTTAQDAALFRRVDGVDADALHVIANGASVIGSPFTDGAERSALGDRLIGQLGLGGPPAAVGPGLRPRRRLAVFVGSGHPPNVDAAQRIVDAVRHRNDVAVALIGRHSELLGGRLPDHIVALGRVENDVLADYLAGADVALNPVEEGSGSNLKLIDYFAAGVPVITSPFGARGVADPERFALLAPPRGLGAALDALFADPDAPTRARAARAYAEAHLDWSSLGRRMAEVTLALARPPADRAAGQAPAPFEEDRR